MKTAFIIFSTNAIKIHKSWCSPIGHMWDSVGTQPVPKDPPPPTGAPWLQDTAALPYAPHLWEAILTPSSPWASPPLAEPGSEPWAQDFVSSSGFPLLLQSDLCCLYKWCTQINSVQLFKLDFTLLHELCGISVLRPSHLHSESTCEGTTEVVRKQTRMAAAAIPMQVRTGTGAFISSNSKALWLWEAETNNSAAKPGGSQLPFETFS